MIASEEHPSAVASVVLGGPSIESCEDSTTSGAISDSKESDRTKSSEDETSSVRKPITQEASAIDVAMEQNPVEGAAEPMRAVAPLAVCEDTAVEEEPPSRASDRTASSPSDVVKRDSKPDLGERKLRNDICPWEDE